MVFDTDLDLTKDFNEIVSGKKKRKDVSDFDFGGFPSKEGVISKGVKIARGKKSRGRPSKKTNIGFKTEVKI